MEKLSMDLEVRLSVASGVWTPGFLVFMCVLLQFLVRMRITDYSLLLGIHDVERAEREENEDEESSHEEEEEGENDQAAAPFSTSPEGIAGYMKSFKPMGPGEFDPYVDVYAAQSAVGECCQHGSP